MRRATAATAARPVVLCVDDDPDILAGLRLTLHDGGAEMLAAGSGEEAVRLLEAQPVTVVVADERMPGTSGLEVLRRAAVVRPEAVRIVLTGHASVPVALAALNEVGVFRFLEKPCSPEAFRQTIDAAVKAHALALRGNRLLHAADEGDELPVRLLTSVRADPLAALTQAERALLTSREEEIVALLADGWRLAHIARTLFVSAHTVRNHLKAIFRKLDVHSQIALVARLHSIK
jgi:DNA-binding NarL/FixJ family response regulator